MTKNKNIEDVYPLAPLQEGILFHSLYEPNSGEYITQVSCTLDNLNVHALEQAWQQVVARHPILRTAFVWKNVKKSVQVVGCKVNVPVLHEDWQTLSTAEQVLRFQTYLDTDRREGFVLSKAPLMRLALFQIGTQAYKFVWSHHHILLDGWSVHLLINELFAVYAGLCLEQPIPLPPSQPFRRYIGWLQEQDANAAEQYWRKALRGFTTPTSLGVDQALDSENGQKRYDDERINLSPETTAALESLSRDQKLTVNTIIQGAWAILLSRYTGAEDVTFGCVVSGRPADLAGVESMIGLFINALPVRTAVPSQAGLLPWLEALQNQQVEMRNFEYSPLVQVQGWSDVPRGQALFESLFTFENYPINHQESEPEIALEVRDYGVVERNNYPLAIIASQGEATSLRIIYDCSRFDLETIQRMLAHLQTIVDGMVTNPDQTIGDVPMMTAQEMQQLMMGRMASYA